MKPADPRILTINGGSSSIKFAVFEVGDPLRRVLEGRIERIGSPEATLRVKGVNPTDNLSRSVTAPDHTVAVGALMDWLERIDEPDKNWKFSLADIHERKSWSQYMKAYEACLSATSTRQAPWYVVPADDKESARLVVSQIALDALKELNLAYPRTTTKRRRELQAIRRLLG